MFHQWLELPCSLSQSNVAIAYVVAPTPDTHPSQVPGNVNVVLNYWTDMEHFLLKTFTSLRLATETSGLTEIQDMSQELSCCGILEENIRYLKDCFTAWLLLRIFISFYCESLNINYWASAYTNRYFIANNELKWIAEFKIRCDADVTNDIIKYHEKCMQNIYIFWLVTPFILPPPNEFGDNTWDLW